MCSGRHFPGILGLACALAAGTAGAAPIVTIRAHTRVEVGEARRAADGFLVRGRLVDDATGVGAPGRTVTVDLDPLSTGAAPYSLQAQTFGERSPAGRPLIWVNQERVAAQNERFR